jgi:hypothetical protein
VERIVIRFSGIVPRSKVSVLAILILTAAQLTCSPLIGDTTDDLLGHSEEYKTAISNALTPVGSEDVVVISGEVVDISPECQKPNGDCSFTLVHDQLYIDVMYHCEDQELGASLQVIERGDQVEVRGHYVELGVIDLCGSYQNYVKQLPAMD